MKALLLGLAVLTVLGCTTPVPASRGHDSASAQTLVAAQASTTQAPGAQAPRGAPLDRSDVDATPRVEHDLTLERALALALDRHPSLSIARAQVAAARAREAGAGRMPNPTVFGGAESAPLTGDTFGNAELVLGFNQSIPLGSRRARSREVREQESEGAMHDARAQLVAVRRSVSGAFATALYAQELSDLYTELVENTARARELLGARVAAGDAIPSELSAADVAHARAARDQRQAEVLAERSRVELASALGDPGCELVSLAGDLGATLDLPTLALLIERLDEYPGVLAAQSRTRAAEAGIAFAEAARIPDLSLELLYRREGAVDADAFDFRVGVPLRLFNSGEARVEESRQLHARARALERRTRITVEADLRLAHLSASRALEQLEFLEREVLPRTTELHEVSRLQYELGDSSLLEALAARRAWLEVRRELLETQRDVLQAWAQLAPYLLEAAQ